MWSGTTAPAGWALCDGNGGTPDLRNRFVVGSGSTYASGNTGGSTTHSHTVDPVNTSSTSNGSHSHTVDPINTASTSAGSHSHTVNPGSFNASIIASGGTASINPGAGFSRVSVNVPSTTSSTHTGHSHNVNIASTTSSTHNGHTHSVDIASTPTTAGSNLPPYYALAYIIKL